MPELIWVQSNLPNDNLPPDAAGLCAFWERHPDHPGGEVFVVSGVHQVARTEFCNEALDKRFLTIVAAPKRVSAAE